MQLDFEFIKKKIAFILRVSNLDVVEELTVLKGQNARLSAEEPIVSNECLRQMEELQETKMSNERKINELAQLYLKPV